MTAEKLAQRFCRLEPKREKPECLPLPKGRLAFKAPSTLDEQLGLRPLDAAAGRYLRHGSSDGSPQVSCAELSTRRSAFGSSRLIFAELVAQIPQFATECLHPLGLLNPRIEDLDR